MPWFITAPGETDVLFSLATLSLLGSVLAVGVLFLWLHSLPERMVHKAGKLQFDIVAVLGLLSLFTHVHLFWVAALLLALIEFPEFKLPEFSVPLERIANSLEKLDTTRPDAAASPSLPKTAAPPASSPEKRA